mmetsp:Transcript_7423/g.10187  ORF Transcript_7423/g.10187 Transcript_7423/m.10187 type:complete len:126 (+) Transcript_7423:3565-3942(+)
MCCIFMGHSTVDPSQGGIESLFFRRLNPLKKIGDKRRWKASNSIFAGKFAREVTITNGSTMCEFLVSSNHNSGDMINKNESHACESQDWRGVCVSWNKETVNFYKQEIQRPFFSGEFHVVWGKES